MCVCVNECTVFVTDSHDNFRVMSCAIDVLVAEHAVSDTLNSSCWKWM